MTAIPGTNNTSKAVSGTTHQSYTSAATGRLQWQQTPQPEIGLLEAGKADSNVCWTITEPFLANAFSAGAGRPRLANQFNTDHPEEAGNTIFVPSRRAF